MKKVFNLFREGAFTEERDETYYKNISKILSKNKTDKITFGTANEIPNVLKGITEEDRSTTLMKIEASEDCFRIPDIIQMQADFSFILFSVYEGEAYVHARLRTAHEYEDYTQIMPNSTVGIPKDLYQRTQIRLRCKTQCIMAIELWIDTEGDIQLFTDIPLRRIPEVTLPCDEDMKAGMSFVRGRIIYKDDILFMATNCAFQVDATEVVIQCSISNGCGSLLFDNIINPRKRIDNYDAHVTGLKEDVVIGRKDEKEERKEIFNIITGKVVVGCNVYKTLHDLLRIPLDNVLGIRELLTNKEIRKRFPIKDLPSKKVLLKSITKSKVIQLGTAEQVQLFYKAYQQVVWLDDISMEAIKEKRCVSIVPKDDHLEKSKLPPAVAKLIKKLDVDMDRHHLSDESDELLDDMHKASIMKCLGSGECIIISGSSDESTESESREPPKLHPSIEDKQKDRKTSEGFEMNNS